MNRNYNLLNFRKSLNKTKEQFADELEISTSFYEKIEGGQRNPSYNFLKKFKYKFPRANIEKIFFDNNSHYECDIKELA